MSRGASVIALLGGLLLLLALPATPAAAAAAPGEQAAVDKMVALNTTAITAYQAGDHQAARSRLLEAVVLGKSNGLDKHGITARTYLHLGIVHIEGLKEREKGLRYMIMALTVRPDIEVTPALATPAVAREFKQARADHAAAPPRPAAEDEDPLAEDDPLEEKKDPAPEKVDKKAAAQAAREAKEQERAAAAAAKEAAVQAAREAKAAEKAAAQAEREAKVLAAAEEKERKKEEKRLALAAAAETKGREKLQKDKTDLESQLAQIKEQHRTEKELREKLEKELAALRAEQKKEREARDKLQKDKGDADRQLAEAREREKKEKEARDRTQKEKADIDRQLAETREREKKEREAREKLDKEKQVADARERERKEAADREKEARARLAEGPDMPGHVPEPVFCPNPEEAYTGRDLYVHCVPRAGDARTLALYYRPSGVVHFNSLAMERGKKGWHLAVIPAEKVSGRSMQYYVEARGGKGDIVATTGKKSLPNIVPLRPAPPPGTAVAESAPAPAPGGKARTGRSPARRAPPRPR